MVGFILITIAFKTIKGHLRKQDMFCDIEVYFHNKKVLLKGMLDTGNMLKEPITGIPVIVAQSKELINILPESLLANTEKIINGEIEGGKLITRLKVIPFTSLGKQNGLLLGFKPDNINILFGDDEKKNISGIIRYI